MQDVQGDLLNWFLSEDFFFLFKMVEFNGLKEKIFEGPGSSRRQSIAQYVVTI